MRVRPIEESDLEMVRGWRNSPEVSRWHITRDIITPAMQEAWFQSICDRPDRHMVWIIETLEARPLGVIQLKDIQKQHRNGELGLYIAELADRGNIYATEAFYLVLNYAFGTLKLHKVTGYYLVENHVARRLNAHFGYSEEGRLREHVHYDGAFHDYIPIGVLEPEFRASPGARFMSRRIR